jgi:cobalt-zinc-cadmium efflux system membrane fusion protein
MSLKPSTRRRRATSAVLLIAGVLASGAWLTGCDRSPDAPPAQAGPTISGDTVRFTGRVDGIRSEAVQDAGDIALTLPGRLIWDEDRTVRVQAPFAGRVVRPLVTAGDTVAVGQPLAEMASAEFGTAVAQARSADNDLQLAGDNLKRLRELHEAGVVSQKDLRQAEADDAGKRIERDRAQTRLKQIGAGSGPNFVLRSPIAGVVVERSVNAGQEFRPDSGGAPLFVITDPARLWVRLDATESELPRLAGVKRGTTLTLVTPAYPDRRFTGTLAVIGDSIDPESRTFRLRGSVPNPDRLLKGEMFVNASFPVAEGETAGRVANVAASAVLLVDGKRYVFVADPDGGFTRIEVKVAREMVSRTAVQGLAANQKVVVEGSLFLQQILAGAKMPAPRASGTSGTSAASTQATTTREARP